MTQQNNIANLFVEHCNRVMNFLKCSNPDYIYDARERKQIIELYEHLIHCALHSNYDPIIDFLERELAAVEDLIKESSHQKRFQIVLSTKKKRLNNWLVLFRKLLT